MAKTKAAVIKPISGVIPEQGEYYELVGPGSSQIVHVSGKNGGKLWLQRIVGGQRESQNFEASINSGEFRKLSKRIAFDMSLDAAHQANVESNWH